MLLAIDIGNSNIVAGIYKNDDLLSTIRISTDKNKTSGEYAALFSDLLETNSIKLNNLNSSIISCVVPQLNDVLLETLKNYFNIEPLIVSSGIKTGMPNLYDNPEEVGADRIVNSVAAYQKYKKSLIVVDFGTATTFDCISENGEYLGGIISPGITISSNALFAEASKLPRVELIKPKNVIGKNTVESMQSGIIFGYAAMVDGLIDKIINGLNCNPKIIATGGLAKLIADESKRIEEVDEFLILKGLKYLSKLNGQL
ncbi:MAG: type III pantothenate kinase [Thermodesulfobacteriota bacterium]